MKQENHNQDLEEIILTILNENYENYGYRLMKQLGLICIKYSHKTHKYRSYKGKIGTIAKH